MLFNRFGLFLANNNRAKCYLQNLLRLGFMPEKVIFIDTEGAKLPELTENDLLQVDNSQKRMVKLAESVCFFDEKEHVLQTLQKSSIPYVIIKNQNINSIEVVKICNDLNLEVLVYAGPGGKILSKELLGTVKFFLHVHPGDLPVYRGSTTIYYAMLAKTAVTCSLIAFMPEIDQGPIFFKKSFPVDSSIDLDYEYDPLVRTSTLLDFFLKFWGKELIPTTLQHHDDGLDFYIIHPMLKHLAVVGSP